jgi:hypothetical protein
MSPRVINFPGCKTVNGASGRIHKCSICGKEGIWAEGWQYRYEIHRGDHSNGDPGWEEVIKTCSGECRTKDNPGKNTRAALADEGKGER